MENESAMEVLSRLPAKSLLRFESVSKEWGDIIKSDFFRRLHCHKVKPSISGFFCQGFLDLSCQVKYVSYSSIQVQNTILDFLPEKVDLISSSNGLLCFCSIQYPVKHVYVCNPAKKEYVQIEWPKGGDRGQKLALAFNPFCHPVDELSDFKIVSVSKEGYSRFLFQLYSSKTKEWRALGFFHCDYECDCLPCGLSQAVFVAGVLYWKSWGDFLIVFDVGTEQVKFIKLPVRRRWRHPFEGLHEICIGESEDRLHFILISIPSICNRSQKKSVGGIYVWILDSGPKWVRKHSIPLSALEEEYPLFQYNDAKSAANLVPLGLLVPPWIEPLLYNDGILVVKLRCSFSYQNEKCESCTKIYLYNLHARTMEELCTFDNLGFSKTVAYGMSLVPLGYA